MRKWCKIVPIDQKRLQKKRVKKTRRISSAMLYIQANETQTHVPVGPDRLSCVWRTEMWMLWPCDHGNESVSTRGRDSPALRYQSSVLISVILNSQCSPHQRYKRHAHSSDAIFDPRRHQCDFRSCLTAKHFPSLKAVRRNVTLKLDWRN